MLEAERRIVDDSRVDMTDVGTKSNSPETGSFG